MAAAVSIAIMQSQMADAKVRIAKLEDQHEKDQQVITQILIEARALRISVDNIAEQVHVLNLKVDELARLQAQGWVQFQANTKRWTNERAR